MEKATNSTTVLYLYIKLQKILDQAGTGYITIIIKVAVYLHAHVINWKVLMSQFQWIIYFVK